MEKIKAKHLQTNETLPYWEKGLSDTGQVKKSLIRVELIQGPILRFSGKDDRVWPASFMSDMIEKRLMENNFSFKFQNIKYENAGHFISGNPDEATSPQKGQMTINNKAFEFNYGGTVEGDKHAQLDAGKRVFEFISKL